MKGEWITPSFVVEPCRIKRGWRKKDGWELKSHLIYHAEDGIMWVADPGYVWDGSSYPSKKSMLGKLLSSIIGDRQKKGLLAASAHHDQMQTNHDMFMYYCDEENRDEWKSAWTDGDLDKFLPHQKMCKINLNVREAAVLYWYMMMDWPIKDETVTFAMAVRQYLGLLIFQPIFTKLGLIKGTWEKI